VPPPDFPGWRLLGAYPDGTPDDVGSWLLHHGGEALLLEVPPGVTPGVVRAGLAAVGCSLRHATASHAHEDHFDPGAWRALRRAFPGAGFVGPGTVSGDRLLHLGGEPLYLIAAPKHSRTDVVAVFRGVAMTGDVELGQLASVNREVPAATKRASMAHLAAFPSRAGYRVHSVVSAHLNDVRTGVDWPALFAV
jgi:hydroxyacylglutathione hydrolase